jgi:hypothetical protein
MVHRDLHGHGRGILGKDRHLEARRVLALEGALGPGARGRPEEPEASAGEPTHEEHAARSFDVAHLDF